ncbi:MAG: hypothetical protein MUC67_01610 [Acidobacteria bacterium]|nr:hypothetical protein [Acidobacteriota bacterium]
MSDLPRARGPAEDSLRSGAAWPESGQTRAPRAARHRALIAALLATLAIQVPLVVGYARAQSDVWAEMARRGIHPVPEYYGFFPLQGPRLVAISLFAVDVGSWVALLMLLPLEVRVPDVFADARRRLRRRWLLAHAPLVPLAAVLGGTRLFGEAMRESGAGAAWFVPALLAVPGTPAAELWVRVEQIVLFALAAAMLVHLALLAGVVRPARWLRNTLVLAAASLALALASWWLLVPVADRGLSTAMRAAQAEALAACPGASPLSATARGAVLYQAFERTPADGPALRERPPYELPLEVATLPPLALPLAGGVAVDLAARNGGPAGPAGLPAGHALTVDGDGGASVLPLPGECGATRVAKIDRIAPWSELAPLLHELGDGPLRLGYRAALTGRPLRPLDAERAPRLVVDGAAPPAGVPRSRVPLPFGRTLTPGTPLPEEEIGRWPRLGRSRVLPHDRESELAVVWRDALPPAAPPAVDGEGRVALAVPPAAAWDDVLRAIAAATRAGARTIYVVASGSAPDSAPSASSRAR